MIVTLKEVGQLNLGGLRLPTGKTYEGSTERLRPMMQVRAKGRARGCGLRAARSLERGCEGCEGCEGGWGLRGL